MSALTGMLSAVPAVYDQLGDALDPTGSVATDKTGPGSSDVHAPAPVRLDVADHRHTLVRGLRWWCAAVREAEAEAGLPLEPVGDTVAAMCRYLVRRLDTLTVEQDGELAENLSDWLRDSRVHVGENDQPTVDLTRFEDAMHRWVPVHIAAQVWECDVRTIRRRAADRRGGLVRLGDCAPTARPVTPEVAK